MATAEKLGLQVIVPAPSPAGEDFAFYQQKIPTSPHAVTAGQRTGIILHLI